MDVGLFAAQTRARLSGRSWWQARYADGHTVSEWDCDWSALPRAGLIEARLICPSGEVAVLGNTIDAHERLFQFKTAIMKAGVGRLTDAHIIGIVTGVDGACQCAAWEPLENRVQSFTDNVFRMQYRAVGRLALNVVGVKLG